MQSGADKWGHRPWLPVSQKINTTRGLCLGLCCSQFTAGRWDWEMASQDYNGDTQLHLAVSVDNTAAGLSLVTACTADVRQEYLQNGLQL